MKDLTTSRWRRIQELCEVVESLAPEQSVARLQELEPDASLRAEVLGVLQALQEEAAEQRLHGEAAQASTGDAPHPLPETIGAVRIDAYLGSGGSGDVYRGVRTTNGTDQAVAVKRFHTHRASAQDLERFAREQRMLATLTHPAIVRFIDAGIGADGHPYLIMELAEGLPIVEYCDTHGLSLGERLQLFKQVCEAVRSAHHHQILHLDLKPSNVLVTDAGGERHVKLVDFGTAKLADPALGATRTEPLTVQYASPERLRGDSVSEACDVYGLGLMLYELASGGWPYRRPESLVAIAERATGTSPTVSLPQAATGEAARQRDVTIDRLKGALRGDLDAMTAKAIAHDPGHRYSSVAALVEDVRRHLAGEPILARPPHFGYVASRWIRRHPWPVAAAAIAIAAIGTAIVYSARPVDSVLPGQDAGTFAAEGRTSMRRLGQPVGFQIFDDFMSPSQSVITGVAWKGIYTSNVEHAPAPAPVSGGFLVGFYADDGGQPNQQALLHGAVYPVERTAETLEGEQLAPCAVGKCGWGHYRYKVTFDTPFVAEPGVRYWLSVQAQVHEIRASPTQPVAFWNWAGMLGSNRRSVLIRANGERAEFELDRLYTLTIEPIG